MSEYFHHCKINCGATPAMNQLNQPINATKKTDFNPTICFEVSHKQNHYITTYNKIHCKWLALVTGFPYYWAITIALTNLFLLHCLALYDVFIHCSVGNSGIHLLNDIQLMQIIHPFQPSLPPPSWHRNCAYSYCSFPGWARRIYYTP